MDITNTIISSIFRTKYSHTEETIGHMFYSLFQFANNQNITYIKIILVQMYFAYYDLTKYQSKK